MGGVVLGCSVFQHVLLKYCSSLRLHSLILSLSQCCICGSFPFLCGYVYGCVGGCGCVCVFACYRIIILTIQLNTVWNLPAQVYFLEVLSNDQPTIP